MVFMRNGGTTWSKLFALNAMMTGAGTFKTKNQTGPMLRREALRFVQRPPWQQTLVSFDPSDPDILVAGAQDAVVFVSTTPACDGTGDRRIRSTSGGRTFPDRISRISITIRRAVTSTCSWCTVVRGAWRLTFKKVLMPEIQVPAPPDFKPILSG